MVFINTITSRNFVFQTFSKRVPHLEIVKTRKINFLDEYVSSLGCEQRTEDPEPPSPSRVMERGLQMPLLGGEFWRRE